MRIYLLLLLFAPGFVMAQADKSKKDNAVVVTGQISGLPGNSTVLLADANNPTDTIAFGSATDGRFSIKGSIDEPNLYVLTFNEVKKKTLLFIGAEKVMVVGDVNDLKHLKVEGSKTHDDFMTFQREFNPIFERLQKSSQGNSGVTFTNADYNTLELKLDSFIFARKDSYVAPFVIVVTSQLSDNFDKVEKRFQPLSERVKAGYFGKYVKSMIDDSKVGSVGSVALDFTQNDTLGKPVSLSSFRGKYVLIDFWASWCGPCRMENPNVVAAYYKFRNKNFTVLGVSLDRAKESWLKAIRDDRLAWTQVSDLKFWSNEVAQIYKIQSIPQNFLVGPDGKIVAKNLRGPALEDKLCELLGCE